LFELVRYVPSPSLSRTDGPTLTTTFFRISPCTEKNQVVPVFAPLHAVPNRHVFLRRGGPNTCRRRRLHLCQSKGEATRPGVPSDRRTHPPIVISPPIAPFPPAISGVGVRDVGLLLHADVVPLVLDHAKGRMGASTPQHFHEGAVLRHLLDDPHDGFRHHLQHPGAARVRRVQGHVDGPVGARHHDDLLRGESSRAVSDDRVKCRSGGYTPLYRHLCMPWVSPYLTSAHAHTYTYAGHRHVAARACGPHGGGTGARHGTSTSTTLVYFPFPPP
jgi:hypothetical protein